MSFLTTTLVLLMATAKIGMFVVAVRNAIRPRPLPISEEPIDPDGPDDGWRWWEEFEPEPEPPEPVDSADDSGSRKPEYPQGESNPRYQVENLAC